MKKNFLIYYCSFVIFSIIIGILFGALISKDFYKISRVRQGNIFFWNVFWNNTENFLLFMFFPIISPVYQFIGLVQTSFTITMSFNVAGNNYTISHLLPHALFEIPNLLFYQGISQYLLYSLFKSFKIKTVISHFSKYWKLYLISYIILVIAAILEGYIG